MKNEWKMKKWKMKNENENHSLIFIWQNSEIIPPRQVYYQLTDSRRMEGFVSSCGGWATNLDLTKEAHELSPKILNETYTML